MATKPKKPTGIVVVGEGETVTTGGGGGGGGNDNAPKGIFVTPRTGSGGADASRKERELERAQQQQVEKFTKGLPTGGLFGRGTITSEQRRAGEALRKLRSEGKITEAEFRASFEAAPTPEQELEAQKQEAGLPITEEGTAQFLEQGGVFKDRPTDITPLVEGTAEERRLAFEQSRVFRTLLNKLGKRKADSIAEIAEDDPAAAFKIAGIEIQAWIGTKFVNAADRLVIGGKFGLEKVGVSKVPFIQELFRDKERFSKIKSSLDKRKELASSTAQAAVRGDITIQDAFTTLSNMEFRLLDDQAELKRLAILSPDIQRLGETTDAEVSMLQQEQAIFDSRRIVAGLVLGEDSEIDTNALTFKIDDYERILLE